MITFVSGYFHVPGNKKHDLKHYLKNVKLTLENYLNDCNLVFFYNNDKFLKHVKKNIKTKNVVYIKRNINQLKTFKISKNYLDSIKNQDNKELIEKYNCSNKMEKGLRHYNRELKKSGENNCRKIFTIWTSKIFLVEEIIKMNPFNTEYFAWIDCGFDKFKKKRNILEINPSQFLLLPGAALTYYNEKINFSASLIYGNKNIWNKIIPLYQKEIVKHKDSNYGHDEETIINLVYKKNKNLFFNIDKYSELNINENNIFIHIPKTGGTSIEKIIFNKNSSNHDNIDIFEKNKEIFNNYFIFSFVRNPYTRIISVYNYYYNGGNQSEFDKNVLDKNLSLENFLDFYSKENLNHLETQFSFLKNSTLIKFIGKFENYNEDCKYIFEKIGLENGELLHKRKTKYHDHIITPKFINDVNKLYKIDFETYDYKMIEINKLIK